ncbi:hypothetical protein Nepgr_032043 [Nepenthes gracilis]|uniref:Uncharacterized protein n=1 Tax=Nepenthes gracilis TaxID=150966 RepID=A0AAD3THW1_NEPGR|nr:hypothetical protein Nepgr_032043 [Nepenthes gracilis]
MFGAGVTGCGLDESSFLMYIGWVEFLKMSCCHHWYPTFDVDLFERPRPDGRVRDLYALGCFCLSREVSWPYDVGAMPVFWRV